MKLYVSQLEIMVNNIIGQWHGNPEVKIENGHSPEVEIAHFKFNPGPAD